MVLLSLKFTLVEIHKLKDVIFKPDLLGAFSSVNVDGKLIN